MADKIIKNSGNDLHLNPNTTVTKWLDESNTAEVYCGYQAVKNSVFTYCNTYYYAKNYDPNASLTLSQRTNQFVWWIPLLIGVDILIMGAMGFWVFKAFKPIKKKED